MQKLEWKKCKKSGHLRADGEVNCYWIITEAWEYFEVVEPHDSGPVVVKHGAFHDLDEAKKYAEVIEAGE